jgi:hypothetical protein
MQTWRTLLAVSAVLTVLAIAAQFLFIGMALAQLGGNGDTSLHVNVGYLLPIFPLLSLVLCWPARAGRGMAILVAVLFVDSFLQGVLPQFRTSATFLAALHPLNAMVLAALAGITVRQAMQLARDGSAGRGSLSRS